MTGVQAIDEWLIPEPNSGCWIWLRSWTSGGYGQLRWNGQAQLVHRVIYEMFKGPIPEGHQLDHLCRNRPCGNHAHLEPVSGRVNNLRSPKCVRTHCAAGHAFTPATTLVYIRNSGRGRLDTRCRICNAEWCKRYKAKRAAS